jgi:type VI secretion system Hcp family effector
MAIFAKYDGVDGESADANHDKWIDVLSIDWGSHKPGGGATGQSRRRGGVIVEDMWLTMEYEKSTPKLLEKLNMGEVIPKVEIEQTANFGGSRATYLKYELKNVQVTAFDVNASGNDESPPTVTIANNFEEYKVTYTEYDGEGNKKGNVETSWKVKKGKKGKK